MRVWLWLVAVAREPFFLLIYPRKRVGVTVVKWLVLNAILIFLNDEQYVDGAITDAVVTFRA